MSLACGPARELRHIVNSQADADGLDLVLADQDDEALVEACTEIQNVERAIGTTLRVETRQLSVRDLLKGSPVALASLGSFDVIYTLGLFDYLTEPVAGRLVAQLTAMLRPGATLIVGNFHVSCSTRAYLDMWMHWPLLYRTEQELMALADGINGIDTDVALDPTNSQMFLSVTRQAGAAC